MTLLILEFMAMIAKTITSASNSRLFSSGSASTSDFIFSVCSSRLGRSIAFSLRDYHECSPASASHWSYIAPVSKGSGSSRRNCFSSDATSWGLALSFTKSMSDPAENKSGSSIPYEALDIPQITVAGIDNAIVQMGSPLLMAAM